MSQQQINRLTDLYSAPELAAMLLKARDVLTSVVAITKDSEGVAGYHLNGNVASWESFPEIEQASALIKQIDDAGYHGIADFDLTKVVLLVNSGPSVWAAFRALDVIAKISSAAAKSHADYKSAQVWATWFLNGQDAVAAVTQGMERLCVVMADSIGQAKMKTAFAFRNDPELNCADATIWSSADIELIAISNCDGNSMR